MGGKKVPGSFTLGGSVRVEQDPNYKSIVWLHIGEETTLMVSLPGNGLEMGYTEDSNEISAMLAPGLYFQSKSSKHEAFRLAKLLGVPCDVY